VLERGQRNDIDSKSDEKTLSSFETYRVLADERRVRDAESRPPKAMATIELLRQPTLKNQGELVWRFGLLFGCANLLLLGIGLAATNPRRASNWNLLFALLGFVVYYNLINLTQAWVGGGRVGLGAAMLSVHGGAFVLALLLLWWRENGVVASLLPRRARPAA
jgi:lipopolysaccharide export system permease protein